MFKYIGALIGVILVVIVLVLSMSYLLAYRRLNVQYDVHTIDLHVLTPKDGEAYIAAVKRGEHLVHARYGCALCHGQDLGGDIMMSDFAMGSFLAPNITRGPGSRTLDYTGLNWDVAVRHGIHPDGTPSLMPAEDYFQMTDQELTDIIAFVNALPPVSSHTAASTLGPMGAILMATGSYPLSAEQHSDHHASHVAEPPATQDSVAFGKLLAQTCSGCHQKNFAGGPMPFGPPSWPAAANLTKHSSGLQDWTFADFDKLLTTGERPDGRIVVAPMTDLITMSKRMMPVERQALWTFLRSLPPTPTNP